MNKIAVKDFSYLFYALFLFFIFACDSSGERKQPELTIEPYVFENSNGDTVRAELGKFNVPENRKFGSKKEIELAFVRFRSKNPSPGPPIVYLAGGPGGSGISTARYSRFPLFMAMREVADVIAFDQRATGISSPIEEEECERTRPAPVNRPLDHETLIQLELEVARDCGDFWRAHGIDLSAYNTEESADDLEALRLALGVEKISLWAISYGTHLALSTIRRHPESIYRVILAGIEGPDHTVKLPAYSQEQLQKLTGLIEQDAEMRQKYPDFIGMVQRTLDELEKNPVTIEFIPTDGGEPSKVVVGRPELERETINSLRDPSSMVAVPAFYERLANGNYFDLGREPTERFEMEAMSEAMDAASGMSQSRYEQFLHQDKETVLGGGVQLANAKMAEALPVPDLGDEFRAPVQSDIPTLFISGTLDGRTPVGNAEEVIGGFPNGVHLVIENAGHSDPLFLSSPRIKDIMLDFMHERPVKSQILTVPPPDFEKVRKRIVLGSDIVSRYLGEYERSPDNIWRVIHTGTYRTLDAHGNVVQENMGIQVRFGGNGYTLLPVSETTFYIPLPGMEQIDFTFVLGKDGAVKHLQYVNNEGELVMLPRIE